MIRNITDVERAGRPYLDGVSASPAIQVEGLAKRYESAGVDALRGVSFTVDEGEIFALLGRNGAGKSTAVRVLTTLLRPSAGRALVVGLDVDTQPRLVRQVIGAALQDAALDELMTGREQLVLGGRLVGLGRRAAADRAEELLEAFGLTGAADRIAARYSGGMRRRLDVAMALVRGPRVLFLDEPTTGLDPQSRRALWDLIRGLRDRGSTILLTTQYLAEADELSGWVGVVHDGRIVAMGSPQELKDRWGTTTVRLRLAGTPGAELPEAVAGEVVLDDDDGWVAVAVPDGEGGVPGLLGRLAAAGLAIERLAVIAPTLEDVFVRLTGTGIESSPGGADTGTASAVRRGMGVGSPR